MQRYIKALKFAMKKHDGQKRTNGDPYIIHPIRVAESLRTVGLEVDHPSVIAALLHDVIEDCGVGYGQLEYEFGKEIADMVALLSDDNRLGRDDRWEDARQRLKDTDWKVKIVKMADRLDNITDEIPWTEKRHKKYLRASELLIEAFNHTDQECKELYGDNNHYTIMVEQLRKEIRKQKIELGI
jgi:GTP pyrophosphokinase